MTPKYDPSNAAHNKIKRDIELGDGLPNLDTFDGKSPLCCLFFSRLL